MGVAGAQSGRGCIVGDRSGTGEPHANLSVFQNTPNCGQSQEGGRGMKGEGLSAVLMPLAVAAVLAWVYFAPAIVEAVIRFVEVLR
jgi:hypothetical protein